MPERQVITALTGVAAPLLVVDVSVMEELDFASFFLPRSWKKSVPFVMDHMDLDFPNGPDVLSMNGFEKCWEIAKNATLLDDIVLVVELPSHTITPVNANVSYSDWPGLAMFEHFHMHYASNTVFNLRPIDIYLRIRKQLGFERLLSMETRCLGDQSTANLASVLRNGTGDDKLWIPLDPPFGYDPMGSLPLIDLSQRVQFKIKFHPLANFVRNPSGATIVPNGPYKIKLVASLLNVTGAENKMFIALSEEPTGITYMIHQNQHDVKDNITSTGPNQPIHHHLFGLSRPLMWVNFGLQPTVLSNNTRYNDPFFYSPNPTPVPLGTNPYGTLEHWYLNAGTQVIQRHAERRFTIYYMYDRFHFGFSGEPQFDQIYAYYPHAVNSSTGFLDYANLANAQLHIHLNLPGSGVDPTNPNNLQSLTLRVTGKDYNFWFIKGGNLTRAFN